jgi:hypothetical protein
MRSVPTTAARSGIRGVIVLAASVGLVVAATPEVAPARATATSTIRSGDAVATLGGSTVELSNSLVGRTWRVAAGASGGMATTALTDEVTGRNWVSGPSADFVVTLDGVALRSDHGWDVLGISSGLTPPDPTRPGAARGVQVTFRLATASGISAGALAVPGGVEVDRTYTLYPGTAVMDVSSTIADTLPVPVRLDAWVIDQISSPASAGAPVVVEAFHGGSDWQADNRDVTVETGSFDDEGQVAQVEAGSGQGFFLVADRRGGDMNRAGRTAARTWVGVEPARDLLDTGPQTIGPGTICPGQVGPEPIGPVSVCPQLPVSGPTNRVPNPAYPVPLRYRTVPPLGHLDLGSAYTGVYHGGDARAAAEFSAHLAGQVAPGWTHSVDLDTFHPWGHGPDYDDANLVPQVDAAAALGVQVFMLDDQWQGSSSGDWEFDPSRFPADPDGKPDIVDDIHSKGMQLGLWMSPVEFNPSSTAYKDHPQWACTPTGDLTAQIPDASGLGVWNVNDPGFRAYITSVVNRLIADYGVSEFKFDYQTWVDCPPYDYLDYEDGFVSLVKSFEALHPDVTFEIDETNDQRLWAVRSATLGPSWFDNNHIGPAVPKLLHDVWSAAPWIPPSSLGLAVYDGTLGGTYSVDDLMSIAVLSHPTFWTDLTKLTSAQRAETAWWIRWYTNHRQELAGAVYEDSAADPLDGTSWVALQPWDGNHGYLFAFRQDGGPSTDTVSLQGLSPSTSYTLRNVRTGASFGVYRGGQLASGFSLSLPEDSSVVISIVPR